MTRHPLDVEPVEFSQSDSVFLSVALRKIDTIHLPSVDKPSQPPDLLHNPPPSSSSHPDPQKSPPFIDTSPKPPLTPVDSAQRAPLAEKPQLSECPLKPLLKDLPPKPQITDLPPKPPGLAPVATEMQGSKMAMASESRSCIQQGEPSHQPAAEDVDESPPGALETPVPLPRKISSVRLLQTLKRFHRITDQVKTDSLSGLFSVLQVKRKIRRVKTIYDCQADNDDELTFAEGEVIIVSGEEDQEWWVGDTHIHHQLYHRKHI